MLCPMCEQNESRRMTGQLIAVRITQRPLRRQASAEQALMVKLAARKPMIVRIAHDSGDGETLFHCPFCGSGQIVARSDGAVDCDFCKTAFTVQVQPQMSAFPQTINGVPIDVPGMPAGGDNADVPPDEAAAAGYPPDANGSDPADDSGGNPFGGGDESTDADEDPAADDGEESTAPPFAKNSMLRTASGARVPLDNYLAHLALQHTPDRVATLARVRTYQRS